MMKPNRLQDRVLRAIPLRVFGVVSLFLTPLWGWSSDSSSPPNEAAGRAPVAGAPAAVEDFKGAPAPQIMDFSAMTGLAIIDSSSAFTLLGTASRKIVDRGFVSDVNNQVFVELAIGPAFFKGNTAFVFSTHLRWDFERDAKLRLFAIGGLGGNATGADAGNRWTLAPRFGIGALYQISDGLSLRGEISHEWMAAGVAIRL